jgi:hypothetical protein
LKDEKDSEAESDDDVVLLQQRQRMNYEHSDFDVPADNGIGDESVVNFVQLSDE